MSDVIERVARAVRLARFERNGMAKAYDPETPLHETELLDAKAALEAAGVEELVGALEIIVSEWDARCDPGDDWPDDAMGVMNDAYKADFITKARAALLKHRGDGG